MSTNLGHVRVVKGEVYGARKSGRICPFVVLLNACPGSGKTTLAWGLASVLARQEAVGAVDLAPDRCLSRMASDCLVRSALRLVVHVAVPSPGSVEAVCRRVAAASSVVVVDTGSTIDPFAGDLVDRAELVVIPTTAGEESVRQAVSAGELVLKRGGI